MRVLLKYKQRESKPTTLETRFGMTAFVTHQGTIDYEQEEEIEGDLVKERVKELKSFSNRNYHSFIIN